MRKQTALENAYDCLWFGYGRKYWNSCGLSSKTADAIWEEASAEFAEHDSCAMGKQFAYTGDKY